MALANVLSGLQCYGEVLAGCGGREVNSIVRATAPFAVAGALYASAPYELRVPPLPVLRLAINLTSSQVYGGTEGDRMRTYTARRHSAFLTPADAAAGWRKSSPSRHLTLYFHPNYLVDDDGVETGWREAPISNVMLPGAGSLIDELANELVQPGMFTAEIVDSLGTLLLTRLARRHGGAQPRKPGLSAETLRRLEEHVQDHLGERILVAHLAAVAGMPLPVFSKAFVHSTGRAPHQFVMLRRVGRANEMLARGSLGVAEIAKACGFANQAHLSNVLRERLGKTPTMLRRDGLQDPDHR